MKHLAAFVLSVATLSSLTACGEDGPASEPSNAGNTGGAGMGGDGNDEPSGALFAVMYEVYDDVGSNSYLTLFDSLDAKSIDISDSTEYSGGRAFLQTYNGWVFVGSPAEPRVTRYSVSSSGELIDEGSVDFGNYGLQAGNLDAWNVSFISPTKAYLLDFVEGTTIIWNPTTMELIGEIPAPTELLRDGWSIDGSPAVIRGDRLYRTFFFANYDTAEYSPDSYLAIYDVAKDKVVELVKETRCPATGNLTHVDEAGNAYFSNWIWPIAGTLMRDAPKSCVLRLNAEEERFDPEWTLDYSSLAEGREGAMFSYLRDGQALMAVFHDENTSFDETTDPWAYAGSNNWSVWSLDMTANTAEPVEGLGLNGGAFTPLRFEERDFIMVPDAETWSSTQIYEIEGNRATPTVEVPGWTYQLVKVR